ncbi:hypothetical protein D9V41_14440 [Aeromicrobium phragmitis]|uniref:Saccharopine dehydrogenase n=1 Tax=Aeromicrobium phragmitis TaxID=2478914 RepID=A0A3L8PI16_9ACTN|nr:hypothetical protein [Aeromicrobium phragmitis]RLV54794.1 hypothetical protein D9V41_14440 [Aeromicrobium phragmitis]
MRIDARSRDSVRAALAAQSPDLLILAAPSITPAVQLACAAQGIACIDVSPRSDLRLANYPELVNAGSPVLTMCGFFPGLSGLLAREASAGLDEVREIRVGLLQSTNAAVGPSGVNDMLRALSRPVSTIEGTRRGFTVKRRMRFDHRDVTVRQMDYDERGLVTDCIPAAQVEYYTAWSNRFFTRTVAGLNAVGLLRALVDSRFAITPKHRPARPEKVHLTVEAEGTSQGRATTRRFRVSADSDYGATAEVVAATAVEILREPHRWTGVQVPMEAFGLDDLTRHFVGISFES